MPPKEADGARRRSARKSGKGAVSADGDALVQERVDDPVPAEKLDGSAEDSDEEVSLRMEAADVSSGKMDSSPPAYGNDASRAALAGQAKPADFESSQDPNRLFSKSVAGDADAALASAASGPGLPSRSSRFPHPCTEAAFRSGSAFGSSGGFSGAIATRH